MDLRHCPREFVSQFIETYRDNPSLWHTDAHEYRDKKKKKAGYEALLALMKTFYENVSIDDVKKRISTIRACYRKERRKVRDSLKSKAVNVYKPTLWYFEMLSFLDDVATPSLNVSELRTPSDNGDEDDEIDFHKIYVAGTQNDFEESSRSSPPHKKPRTSKRPPETQKEIIEQNIHTRYDDEFDIMGKCFANKLRRISKLSRERVGIAEKLINDVLFQAEFVDISMDARIVNLTNQTKSSDT